MKLGYSTIKTELSEPGPRVRLLDEEIVARPPCCLPSVCAFCGGKPAYLPGEGIRSLGTGGRVNFVLCRRHFRTQKTVKWIALFSAILVYPAMTLLALSYERQFRVQIGFDVAAWVITGVPALIILMYYYGVLFASCSASGVGGWVRVHLRNRSASDAVKSALRQTTEIRQI